jgi:hypothetical protein
MSNGKNPNALKHGAFSKILILPGEDPEDYNKLESGLFAEYQPSGCSEEETIREIARSFWQERRMTLYEHVKFLRAQKSKSRDMASDPLEAAFAAISVKLEEMGERDEIILPPSAFPPAPINMAEKSDEDALLELGELVTFDYLDKQLDVASKLHSKIDRLFKRFFQMKGTKPLMGLAATPAPALISDRTTLELTAIEATKPSELPSDTQASEQRVVDPIKPPR